MPTWIGILLSISQSSTKSPKELKFIEQTQALPKVQSEFVILPGMALGGGCGSWFAMERRQFLWSAGSRIPWPYRAHRASNTRRCFGVFGLSDVGVSGDMRHRRLMSWWDFRGCMGRLRVGCLAIWLKKLAYWKRFNANSSKGKSVCFIFWKRRSNLEIRHQTQKHSIQSGLGLQRPGLKRGNTVNAETLKEGAA